MRLFDMTISIHQCTRLEAVAITASDTSWLDFRVFQGPDYREFTIFMPRELAEHYALAISAVAAHVIEEEEPTDA